MEVPPFLRPLIRGWTSELFPPWAVENRPAVNIHKYLFEYLLSVL